MQESKQFVSIENVDMKLLGLLHALTLILNPILQLAVCAVLALPVTDTDLATGEEGGKAWI